MLRFISWPLWWLIPGTNTNPPSASQRKNASCWRRLFSAYAEFTLGLGFPSSNSQKNAASALFSEPKRLRENCSATTAAHADHHRMNNVHHASAQVLCKMARHCCNAAAKVCYIVVRRNHGTAILYNFRYLSQRKVAGDKTASVSLAQTVLFR